MPWAIWLVIELDRDITPISIVTKLNEDQVRIARVREWTMSILTKFHQLRGHNSEVSLIIWLVIELDQNIIPISIVNKCC